MKTQKFELKPLKGEWYIFGETKFIKEAGYETEIIASTAKIEGVLQLDRKPFDNYGKVDVDKEAVKVLKNGYTNQPEGTIGFVIAYDYKLKPKHENGIIKNFKLI